MVVTTTVLPSLPSGDAMSEMVRPSGADFGYNARISNVDLGSVDVRVDSITHGTTINSQESIASQAKTFYPLKISESPFIIRIQHRTKSERNVLNNWMREYMVKASTHSSGVAGYLTVSVPSRRFYRQGVVEGTLGMGDSVTMRGTIYTTTLNFIASTDPAARVDVSRVRHSEDWEILKHYPSGQQAGWSIEETVYDRGKDPVIRPGQPDRPV